MSDFTHEFWNWYIAIATIVSIVACGVLLRALTTRKVVPGEQVGMTGHVWDEDLEEYNNPTPATICTNRIAISLDQEAGVSPIIELHEANNQVLVH